MKPKDRYIVMKLADVHRMSASAQQNLLNVLQEYKKVRADRTASQVVVIESGWPEYETTVALLAARVDGAPPTVKVVENLTKIPSAFRGAPPVKVGKITLEVGMQTDKVQRLTEFLLDAVSSGEMSEHCARQLGEYLKDLSFTEASPDANVELNRKMLLDRSVVGLQKYGVTTERNDLTPAQWAQHAIEEALDFANYLQALKKKLEDLDNE